MSRTHRVSIIIDKPELLPRLCSIFHEKRRNQVHGSITEDEHSDIDRNTNIAYGTAFPLVLTNGPLQRKLMNTMSLKEIWNIYYLFHCGIVMNRKYSQQTENEYQE